MRNYFYAIQIPIKRNKAFQSGSLNKETEK